MRVEHNENDTFKHEMIRWTACSVICDFDSIFCSAEHAYTFHIYTYNEM